MKSRTASILIGILAMVCLGLVFSVVYPFTTSDPHASVPQNEQMTTSDEDAFSANGSIVVDGEVALAFDGVVTADGAWYHRLVEGDMVSEAYQSSSNGTVYHRWRIEGGDEAEQRRESLTEKNDTEIVSEERNGDRVTFIIEENGTGSTEPVSGAASVIVNSLSVARYESESADSSTDTIYKPQSGWYDEAETYRLTDASGDIRADADTHVVKSANVSWDMTRPAGTYAEYVLARSLGEEPNTFRTTYEFDSGDTDLEQPTWVDEADST